MEEKVLLVDDESDVRLFCRLKLEAASFKVLEAGDGVTALKLVGTEKPDLVLLDVMMPGMDGWNVLAVLKEDAKTAAIPVILITARTAEQEQIRGWHLGASDILLKPFSTEALLHSVRGALVREREEARKQQRDAALLKLHARTLDATYQLAAIVDSSQDAIIGKSLDDVILSWNRGAERLYGYSANEAIGRPVSLVVPPDRLAELKTIIDRVREGQPTLDHETERLHKSGKRIQVNLSVSPILDPAGRVVAAAAVARDVTKSKQAQDLFRKLIEAAPDAIVIVSSRGLIQLVNAQTERLFGYERDELLGKPVEMVVPDRFRWVHPSHREEYFKAPRLRPMGAGLELSGRRKDGTEFPVEISLSPVETVEGMIVSAAIRDVSGMRRAERKFRALLEAAPDAMVIVNAEGVITLVNAQVERLFGYGREELIGSTWEILVAEQLRESLCDRARQFLQHPIVGPIGADLQLYGLRKDGSEFPMEISLSPLHTEEGALVSAAIRDVSSQKRAELAMADAYQRERAAAQQLRDVDKMKSDFLSTVSHELRTPLTTVKGFADLLGSDWDNFSEDRRRDLVSRIGRSANRLDSLIADLLDFTRLERGKLHIQMQECNLARIVRDVVRKLESSLEGHPLQIRIAPDLQVQGDPSALGRVIENLLTNAAKFSPPGSPIGVLAEPASEQEAVIQVVDRGPGVPEEERERIFERFYRVQTPGHVFPGTGVGLSIVKEFLEAQGGRVWVESGHGEGSTFCVRLGRVPAGQPQMSRG